MAAPRCRLTLTLIPAADRSVGFWWPRCTGVARLANDPVTPWHRDRLARGADTNTAESSLDPATPRGCASPSPMTRPERLCQVTLNVRLRWLAPGDGGRGQRRAVGCPEPGSKLRSYQLPVDVAYEGSDSTLPESVRKVYYATSRFLRRSATCATPAGAGADDGAGVVHRGHADGTGVEPANTPLIAY